MEGVPPAFSRCSWSLTCRALGLSGHAEGIWIQDFILYKPRYNVYSSCPAVEPCEHVQNAQGALGKLLFCCTARARTWVGKEQAEDGSVNGLMTEFPHTHPSVKGRWSSWKKSLIITTQIKAAWNTKLEILWIQTSPFLLVTTGQSRTR